MSAPLGILYVDADPEALHALPRFLSRCGPVRTVTTLNEARAALAEHWPALVVIDPDLPDGQGTDLMREIHAAHPWIQLFAICDPAWVDKASILIAAGASDVATKPFDVGTLADRVARLLRCAETSHQETAYRQQLEARLAHSERIATLGTLCATVAHEVANPLGAVTANAYLISAALRGTQAIEGDLRRSLAEASDDVVLAGKLIEEFIHRIRAFARRDHGEHIVASLGGVVDTATSFLKEKVSTKRVRLRKPPEPGPSVLHSPTRFAQALLNVLGNALDAIEPGGTILIQYVEDTELAGIVVDDDGGGLSEEARQHVFEPFFTTKPHGTGLGLKVIQDVLGEHGGRFELRAREGLRGTSARLLIPKRRTTTRHVALQNAHVAAAARGAARS